MKETVFLRNVTSIIDKMCVSFAHKENTFKVRRLKGYTKDGLGVFLI